MQLARLRSARVIALVGAGKEEKVCRIGASAVITRGAPSLSDAMAEAAGRSIDVVTDVVGGEIFLDLLNVLIAGCSDADSGSLAQSTVALTVFPVFLQGSS